MLKTIQIIFILLVLKVMLTASMSGSKHDLSATNFYGPSPGSTTEICVFCHTPHASSTTIDGPLWNRNITDTGAFILYSGVAGVPNNPSLICLSCHDGVNANADMSAVDAQDSHYVINSPGAGHGVDSATPNCYACHFSGEMYPGTEWTIGPDLTDDHPVSVSYANAVTNFPGKFHPSPQNNLRLDNGNVECISCHDPHKVDTTYFLRISNQNSDLCKSCHIQ